MIQRRLAQRRRVSFLSGGSGGLQLDGTGSAYSGKISGFGGSGHSNHNQSIDFTAISAAGASFTYTSGNTSNTSGTLSVTDGTHSATVVLVGSYSSGNFVSGSDSSGHLLITDPQVVSGGLVLTGTTSHTANLALLGNYMAGSFATTGGGQAGMLTSGTQQADQPPLTHPPHG